MSMLVLITAAIAGLLVLAVVGWLLIVAALRNRAAAAGHDGVLSFLRATPRNDAEKRDAVDLTLQGVVLCVLGFLFPPLLLVGLVPLYYGARKLSLVWLGLDILDEVDASGV